MDNPIIIGLVFLELALLAIQSMIAAGLLVWQATQRLLAAPAPQLTLDAYQPIFPEELTTDRKDDDDIFLSPQGEFASKIKWIAFDECWWSPAENGFVSTGWSAQDRTFGVASNGDLFFPVHFVGGSGWIEQWLGRAERGQVVDGGGSLTALEREGNWYVSLAGARRCLKRQDREDTIDILDGLCKICSKFARPKAKDLSLLSSAQQLPSRHGKKRIGELRQYND